MTVMVCVFIVCCLIGFLAYVDHHNDKLKCQHAYEVHAEHTISNSHTNVTHTHVYVLKCSKCGILKEKRIEP